MNLPPIKKLILPAGQAFGPLSGLGPLEHGPFGDMRRVMGPRIVCPIAFPAPFLWELHLTAFARPPRLHLTLDGDAAASEIRLPAGQRVEALGVAHPLPGVDARRLSFTLVSDFSADPTADPTAEPFADPRGDPTADPGADLPELQLWFLGLALLPLSALVPR